MFEYLINKVKDAEFETDPFKHIEIQNFLNEDHFKNITENSQIDFGTLSSDKELIDVLTRKGWAPVSFPGTTPDVDSYLRWHKNKGRHSNLNTCEGFGIVFRLMKPDNPLLEELNNFLCSEAFCVVLAEKFGVDYSLTYSETGIQKYLDGYEISPHPDIRRKAITYMVNINPAEGSESYDFHTHYMSFTPDKHFVQTYWEGNPTADRCWVPWDWCATSKRQRENNSVVIFSPANDTMHAVKAKYDHLKTQRTQLYGNLWYKEERTALKPSWESFVIKEHTPDFRDIPKQLFDFKDKVTRRIRRRITRFT